MPSLLQAQLNLRTSLWNDWRREIEADCRIKKCYKV